jgi:hypothetical protein
MAFAEVGRKVHFYVMGWELYDATITEVSADGKNCSIEYMGGQPANNEFKWPSTQVRRATKLEGIDLQKMYFDDAENAPVPQQNKTVSSNFADATGDFIIAEYDPDFADEGYDEMTNMRKLNDCELCRSLEKKFFM